MSHQRAPGFGRPPQIPSNVSNNLNILSSGFWSKSTNNYNTNPFTYPTGNQFNENINNSSTSMSFNRFDQSPTTPTNNTLFRDDYLWKQASVNPIQSVNSISSNQSRPMGINVSTSTPNPTSTYTPLNNLTINSRAKSSQSSRNQSTTTHDLLLAQFLGLCLDNQQSISNDNLNSLSSSSSHGSPYTNKLIDSNVTSSLNQSNTISLRKLKARTEDNNLSSLSNHNITLDQYQPSSFPVVTSAHNGGGGRRKNRRGSCIECVFCKNNGQPASFYQSHVLKDVLGRVTCPILSAYDCPICHNGGGPRAHTVRYCPQNKPSNRLRNALLKAQIG